MHSGVDLIDSWHDTVYATASGVVRYSGWNYGYGRCIEIEHAFSFTTKYAHLHKILVRRDDNVIKGQAIGIMGSTGDVTGQHLHYEISHDGKTIDPLPYINCTPINVKATMYHPVEAQCDSDPLVTADGSIIDPYQVSSWNWIAVSQDMLVRNGGILNYGDEVYISGTHKDGLYTIHDCMNRRKTNQIDFLENIGTKQYKYQDVELYVLK
jgi:3D (Asp-Asp-Asp) domain-containing protein